MLIDNRTRLERSDFMGKAVWSMDSMIAHSALTPCACHIIVYHRASLSVLGLDVIDVNQLAAIVPT